MESQKISVALVGVGRAGHFHLTSIQMLPKVNLKYVVDTNQEAAQRVAKQFNTQVGTWEQVLQDPEVKAVIIATPASLHINYILDAFKNDKHVFAEKPAGASLEEVRTIYQQQEQFGKVFHVGFQRRWDPSYKQVLDQVKSSGEKIQVMKFMFRDCPLPPLEFLRQCDGLQDAMTHDFDLCFSLVDEKPLEVFAMGSNFIPEIKDFGNYDTRIITVKFPSGIMATFDGQLEAKFGYDIRMEVFTGERSYFVDVRPTTMTRTIDANGIHEVPIDYTFVGRFKEAYFKELEAFFEAVQGNAKVPKVNPTASQHENLYILFEAINKSLKDKAIVYL